MTMTSSKMPPPHEGDDTLEHLAERLPESNGQALDHSVQFYETDAFLVEKVSQFIAAGLVAGDACLVFATPGHQALLEERLQASGLDLADARLGGAYLSLDAAETLAQMMVAGQPAPERFMDVVGSRIARAGRNGRRVRVFGEMVALLVQAGNQAAAIRLEALWNALCQRIPSFSLLCAYQMQSLAGDGQRASFLQICQQHSQTMPTEQYLTLANPEERLRSITLLQQKADSLEAEVAERKDVEERLRVSENRYRRLFEASTDGIVLVDPRSLAITEANPAMTRLLGIPQEHLLGQELWQVGLFEDRPALLEAVRALEQQQVARFEALPLFTSDGERRYVEVVGTLYQANGHQVMQWNLRDITARKRAEAVLQANEQELEAQRAAFVGMITHELRTPLTALQGNVQLAQRQLTHLLGEHTALSAEHRRALEGVLTTLSRARQQLRVQSRLINDLLDSSSMQEDKLALRLAPCDLGRLVYETVQDYQAGHPARVFTLELPEHGFFPVYADRDRLQQALGNYLSNALKFSPESAPIHVGLTLEDGYIRVWVRDHGPGLTREQQARIWERFYQAPQTPVQRGSRVGLGLGLSICQHLITRQQGQVGIESTPGNGATFWFRLPLRPA